MHTHTHRTQTHARTHTARRRTGVRARTHTHTDIHKRRVQRGARVPCPAILPRSACLPACSPRRLAESGSVGGGASGPNSDGLAGAALIEQEGVPGGAAGGSTSSGGISSSPDDNRIAAAGFPRAALAGAPPMLLAAAGVGGGVAEPLAPGPRAAAAAADPAGTGDDAAAPCADRPTAGAAAASEAGGGAGNEGTPQAEDSPGPDAAGEPQTPAPAQSREAEAAPEPAPAPPPPLSEAQPRLALMLPPMVPLPLQPAASARVGRGAALLLLDTVVGEVVLASSPVLLLRSAEAARELQELLLSILVADDSGGHGAERCGATCSQYKHSTAQPTLLWWTCTAPSAACARVVVVGQPAGLPQQQHLPCPGLQGGHPGPGGGLGWGTRLFLGERDSDPPPCCPLGPCIHSSSSAMVACPPLWECP